MDKMFRIKKKTTFFLIVIITAAFATLVFLVLNSLSNYFWAGFLAFFGSVEIILAGYFWKLFGNIKKKSAANSDNNSIYQALVESSQDAVVIHRNNRIFFVNSASLELFGARNKKELMQKNILDFIHPSYRPFFIFDMKKMETAKKIPLRDSRILRLNGDTREVEISDASINYSGLPAVYTSIRDLSCRTIAIHDAPDPIFIMNSKREIIYANTASQKMTGILAKDMLGHKPSLWGGWIVNHNNINLSNKELISQSENAWDKINSQNPHFSNDVVNFKKSGERYIAELHVSPVFDENKKIAFYLAIERDVTKIKEIDRKKNEFISIMAHELRTPLASISLSAELLLRGLGGDINMKQIKYLKEIYNTTHRMSELIYSFLNISRIELGTFSIKKSPINIAIGVDEVLSYLEPLIKEKNIALEKRYDDRIITANFDQNVLKIIIDNIISNSLRYTPAGGKIIVQVSRKQNGVFLKISDTGVGIPANDQLKVFSKAFRSENAKKENSDGLGLGLYIVKMVAEKAGAKIRFESKEGQGTIFYLEISE